MRASWVVLVLVVSAIAAHAQPSRPAPWRFDATGWTLLGSHTVDGKRDRDTIVVGRYQGRFDELQLVVTDSDLELDDFTVVFANGERFTPKLKHSFREGQRSRAIDLPGNDRTIAKIELAYRNRRGGGKAAIQVYGRDKRGPAPTPTPAPVIFDRSGWTLLGTQTVDGRRDRDTIRVGRYKGKFDQLTMVVSDSDIELKDLTIVFANNQKWSPRLAHFFRQGQRTRVIDLPGKDRTITRIELTYANIPGGGRARVEVFGRDGGRPAPPPITRIRWDNKGWTQLGKATVDGWRDRDRIDVRSAVPFSELMFVVSGSDLELFNVVVTFANNERFEMPSRVVFREGTRTSPIDLPGNARRIRSIELAYANLPGGGKAQLEVWARRK